MLHWSRYAQTKTLHADVQGSSDLRTPQRGKNRHADCGRARRSSGAMASVEAPNSRTRSTTRRIVCSNGKIHDANRVAQKNLASTLSRTERLQFVEPQSESVPISLQVTWLGLNRTRLYYRPVGPDPQEVAIKHRIDEIYTASPFYGSRRLPAPGRDGHSLAWPIATIVAAGERADISPAFSHNRFREHVLATITTIRTNFDLTQCINCEETSVWARPRIG